MKKTLLSTVAVAAVVGFSALATAQTADQGKDATKTPGSATQEQKATPGGTGGAMMKPQGGQEQHPAQPAQGAQNAKPDQRIGQDQQKETTPQKGAQEERGTPQKGAQEERGTQQKGTQDDRSTPTKGAQEDNKSGVNANQKNANESKGSRGATAQVSQDQRTKIQGIIGHNSSARVTTNVNFNVTVGTRVPSDVQVVVLPEDVVEIVPQYQGFDYVIVGDNILIIDPNTMEIVDIIPA
jgi:hypothetical protein